MGRPISRVLSRVTISLGARSPALSCSLPAGFLRAEAPRRASSPPAAWLCSERGLPCLPRCRRSGGLLPRLFTLCRRAVSAALHGHPCTPRRRLGLMHPPRGMHSAGLFSVALSVAGRAGARALPGVLLCGARTFLPADAEHPRGGDLVCPHIVSAIADTM